MSAHQRAARCTALAAAQPPITAPAHHRPRTDSTGTPTAAPPGAHRSARTANSVITTAPPTDESYCSKENSGTPATRSRPMAGTSRVPTAPP